MLRIWQKTEKQKLEPVGMGTAFPFLKEKNHVVSIIGGGGKTTLLYENFDAHLPSAEGMA